MLLLEQYFSFMDLMIRLSFSTSSFPTKQRFTSHNLFPDAFIIFYTSILLYNVTIFIVKCGIRLEVNIKSNKQA